MKILERYQRKGSAPCNTETFTQTLQGGEGAMNYVSEDKIQYAKENKLGRTFAIRVKDMSTEGWGIGKVFLY